MSAIVTDQFRVSNAKNFVDSVLDPQNSHYVFLSLPNPSIVGFGRPKFGESKLPAAKATSSKKATCKTCGQEIK
jgi:hypothetical protein